MAKNIAQESITNNNIRSDTPTPFTTCEIQLEIGTRIYKKVCSTLHHTIQEHIHKNDLRQYWIQKKN